MKKIIKEVVSQDVINRLKKIEKKLSDSSVLDIQETLHVMTVKTILNSQIAQAINSYIQVIPMVFFTYKKWLHQALHFIFQRILLIKTNSLYLI